MMSQGKGNFCHTFPTAVVKVEKLDLEDKYVAVKFLAHKVNVSYESVWVIM